MRILGVDFGEAKVGLAYASGFLAEPLEVFRYRDEKELFDKIRKLVEREKIEKIIVGVSEGKSAQKSKNFAKKLKEFVHIPTEFEDETLTSEEANKKAIEAGIKRSKRKSMEDAYAATIILQNWLDRQ